MLPMPANAASCANQGREAAGTAIVPLTSGSERTPSLARQPFSSSTSSRASEPLSLPPDVDAGASSSRDGAAGVEGAAAPAAACPTRPAQSGVRPLLHSSARPEPDHHRRT